MKKVKQGKEMIVWRILYYIGWVVKDFLKAGHLNKWNNTKENLKHASLRTIFLKEERNDIRSLPMNEIHIFQRTKRRLHQLKCIKEGTE